MDLWREMGLDGQRALIVHHDDLGVTHAQTQAYLDLGYPTGSLMAPAAWCTALAAHPAADLGVHLTLNSEWTAPRLRPLTPAPTLCDAQGFLWRDLASLWQHADIGEVEAELRAQVEAIYRLGVDVTHLDTHMGSIMRPDIAAVYLRLAEEYRLPAMVPAVLEYHSLPEAFRAPLGEVLAGSTHPRVQMLSGYGRPPEEMRGWYLRVLRKAGPGVYHLIHHAALDTPEARALPDWQRRTADLEAFRDAQVRRAAGEYRLLTYREVREAYRALLPRGA
ncbi:MAG: ChbG/HpnK family deacetylase [Chloroflexi bacterium]|nr:ChbG/HpnK family deacetylase [Chloroflexota bacterium]